MSTILLSEISPFSAFLMSFTDGSTLSTQIFFLIFGFLLFLASFLVPAFLAINSLDRKIRGDIQMRIGPNLAGPHGIFQGVADFIKSFEKIRTESQATSGGFFFVTISMAIAFLVFAAINVPVSSQWLYSNVDLSALFVVVALVVSRLFLFWSAYKTANAWSTVSAFNMLSVIGYFLVPLTLALVSPALLVGSLDLQNIALAQGGMPWEWMVFNGPGSFFSFASFAVALFIWHGRAPSNLFFESTSVKSEVISEFEGRRYFVLKQIEVFSLFLAAALIVTVYLGAWRAPFSLESFGRAANIVEACIFFTKTMFVTFVMIWFRWSMPSARLKQISNLSWYLLLPAGFAGVAITLLWLAVSRGEGVRWWL